LIEDIVKLSMSMSAGFSIGENFTERGLLVDGLQYIPFKLTREAKYALQLLKSS